MEPNSKACKVSLRKPRLCVLTTTYPRDDADTTPAFVFELCRQLAAQFEITVLAPAAEGAREGDWDGVKVVRYRYAPQRWQQLTTGGGILPNLRRSPALLVFIPGLLLAQAFALFVRRRQFDVIHAHWLIPGGFIARLCGGGRPVVATSHGADVLALRGRFWDGLRRWVMRGAFAVTAVGEPLRAVLQAEVTGKQVLRLPMGCDLQRFSPQPGGHMQSGRLVFVGRLVPKKGVDSLLQALALLKQQHTAFHLSIIGDGPERDVLQQLSDRLGLAEQVRFLGGIANASLAAEYRQAETVVLPFRTAANGDAEGLGLTLIEALACGCKVVVGQCAAQEALTADCPGLWRCDADDWQALAEAIRSSLHMQLDAAALRAEREPRLLPFAWATVAAGYADVLHRAHRSRA